jgi:GntR family transcriptional regulator
LKSILSDAPGLSRYGALAGALRARITGGDWPPGTALPAEQALAAEHGVALGTLRQALSVLADEGLVERRHGRGTFVRAGLAGAPMLRFFRFGGVDGNVGGERERGPPVSRILTRHDAVPPQAVAAALDLPAGRPALRLRRLRSVDGVPRLLEQIWLPLPLFAALQHGDPADWGDLLYPCYAERCGVHVQRATDEIGFGALNAADARTLHLPTAHPCAVVQRRAYDIAGRCVEWRVTRGDAHAFHYTVAIT